MNIIKRFGSLPVGTRRLMGLGTILGLTAALPIFVLTIVTQNFNPLERAQNGPTNACGGTCGSVYNCDTGLFCYNGFCRNPDCRDDTTCMCATTPTPSSSPTKKPAAKLTSTPVSKGSVTATATPVEATPTYSPTPSPTSVETLPPEITSATSKGIGSKNVGIIVGGIILGIAGIFLLISRIKKRPPKFTPPTGEGFNPPPANPPVTPPPGF